MTSNTPFLRAGNHSLTRHRCSGVVFLRLRTPWLLLALPLLLVAHSAHAAESMTRDEIIDLAKSAVGHGYKWGFGYWTQDGSKKGSCSKDCDSCGCPKCSFPSDKVGADCSGLVTKSWQVPSPSAVEADTGHPYTTKSFYAQTLHWTQISRDELKAGDALVYRNAADTGGHIVIFDKFDTGGKYWVYEARGCSWGIVHNSRTFSSDYIAIRRNDVEDKPPCTPDSCSSHGTCSEGVCTCDAGYGGDKCDHCDEGFIGYPTCVAPDWTCAPQGELHCEDSATITPQHGSRDMANYACGLSQLDEAELVYRFSPRGTGTAKISIEGSGHVLALRGACAPEGCVAGDDSSIDIDYAGNEVFYVVVESRAGASDDVKLNVDCDDGEGRFIGDACNANADCAFTLADGSSKAGTCYETASGGFCTLDCERFCPDLPPNKAPTFCIADPADEEQGICVSKADRLNQQCAQIRGTQSQNVARFSEPNKEAEVCAPQLELPSCSGSLAGSVLQATSGAGIEAAHVSVAGATPQELTTDARGQFATIDLACGDYTVTAEAEGFESGLGNVAVRAEGAIVELRLQGAEQCTAEGALSGFAVDALNGGNAVAEATIVLYPELDNVSSEPVGQALTDAQGSFIFDGIPSGSYTVVAEAEGYDSARANATVCGGEDGRAVQLALTPTREGATRITLSWQQPQAMDLDLHLQLPNGEEIFFDDGCRGTLDSVPYALLDVDAWEGPGQETITLSRGMPGTYTLFVHNFSQQNEEAAEDFNATGARVTVVGPDGNSQSFAPPSGSGYFWDVLTFEGTTPEAIRPLQRVGSGRANPYNEYHELCRP